MKRTLAITSNFLLALMLVVPMNSCKKDSAPSTVVEKKGIALQGSQEVPVKVTAASGTVDVSYDKATKMLHYTAIWNGLTAPVSGMHFHGPAVRGEIATVIVPITDYPAGTAGTVTGMITLNETTQKEADLLANKWYFNIHTSTNPGGEIRGQVEF
jgi:hypothetical protein